MDDITETGWWAEWDEGGAGWRPTVQLPGSLAASLEGIWFYSETDCLAFVQENLPSLGRLYPDRSN